MLRVIQPCCFNWGFLRALFPPWIWMPLTSRLSFFLLVLVVLLSGWIWKALVVPSIFGMYLDTSSSKLVIQSSFYCPIYLSDRREIGHTVTAPGKTQVDGAVSSSGGVTQAHHKCSLMFLNLQARRCWGPFQPFQVCATFFGDSLRNLSPPFVLYIATFILKVCCLLFLVLSLWFVGYKLPGEGS